MILKRGGTIYSDFISLPVQVYRKRYCTTLGGGGGKRYCTTLGGGDVCGIVGISIMLEFYNKDFYVMGKALSGELSCMWTGLVTLRAGISSCVSQSKCKAIL